MLVLKHVSRRLIRITRVLERQLVTSGVSYLQGPLSGLFGLFMRQQ